MDSNDVSVGYSVSACAARERAVSIGRTHKRHGVNTLVPAAGDNSRYWGQGQRTTASLTPGLFLNSSQSEMSSNSRRLGVLAGVAAKSWTRTRYPRYLSRCARYSPAASSVMYVPGLYVTPRTATMSPGLTISCTVSTRSSLVRSFIRSEASANGACKPTCQAV